MNTSWLGALAGFALALPLPAAPVLAQPADNTGLGEIVVSANRGMTRYALLERPVAGLRRQADGAVVQVSISSDSRDAALRKKEIYAVLMAAFERAPAAGIELVSGGAQLSPVTKANYADLPLVWAGRVDTSKIDLMFKVKLAGSAAATEKKLTDFITALPKSGRGVIDKTGNLSLTIVEPDQYRDAVLKLVAEDARHNAAIFGPDFTYSISGIDLHVSWSQVSSTEVFVYLPYRYSIVPK